MWWCDVMWCNVCVLLTWRLYCWDARVVPNSSFWSLKKMIQFLNETFRQVIHHIKLKNIWKSKYTHKTRQSTIWKWFKMIHWICDCCVLWNERVDISEMISSFEVPSLWVCVRRLGWDELEGPSDGRLWLCSNVIEQALAWTWKHFRRKQSVRVLKGFEMCFRKVEVDFLNTNWHASIETWGTFLKVFRFQISRSLGLSVYVMKQESTWERERGRESRNYCMKLTECGSEDHDRKSIVHSQQSERKERKLHIRWIFLFQKEIVDWKQMMDREPNNCLRVLQFQSNLVYEPQRSLMFVQLEDQFLVTWKKMIECLWRVLYWPICAVCVAKAFKSSRNQLIVWKRATHIFSCCDVGYCTNS